VKRLALIALFGALSCRACFDPEEGHAYPCVPVLDGGDRTVGCASGWRCGLEQICHDPDAGAAYQCLDDSWCERGWQCASSGKCTPPVDDGLRVGADGGVMRADTLELNAPRSLPDSFAATPEALIPPSFNASGFGYTRGNEFLLVARARLGPPNDVAGEYQLALYRATLPVQVKQTAAGINLVDQTLVLSDAGVAYVAVKYDAGFYAPLGGDPDAGFVPGPIHLAEYTPVPEWSGATGDGLRLIPASPPFAMVFGKNVHVLHYPQIFPTPGSMDSGFRDGLSGLFKIDFLEDGGPTGMLGAQMTDLTSVISTDGGRAVAAVIDGRLYLAPYSGGDFQAGSPGVPAWIPAVLFGSAGAFGALTWDAGYLLQNDAYQARRLRAAGSRLAIETVSSTGESGVMLGELSNADRDPFLPLLLQLRLFPCSVCGPDGGIKEFHVSDVGPLQIEVRCNDGSTVIDVTTVGGVCATLPAIGSSGALRDDLKAAVTPAGVNAWTGAHGQVWFGDSLTTATPFALDQPPALMISADQGQAAISGRQLFIPMLFGTPTSGIGFGFTAAAGFTDDDFVPVAGITGRSDWGITRGGYAGRKSLGAVGGAVVAVRGDSVDPRQFTPPYQGVIGRTSDGGHALIASAFDALYGADVTAIHEVDVAPPGVFEFRAVPQQRVPIRSLTALDVFDGGVWSRGYALARSDLFEWVAETPEHWRVNRIDIPPGAPLELWSDSDRGRLGYDDGRVYSLPGFKKLASALDAGVIDYEQLHGQPFALTAQGLYRLQSPVDGGVTGTWQSDVELRTALGDLHGARMFAAGGKTPDQYNQLFIFNAYGNAVVLRPP
jgi:hypothetical protein